PYSTWFWTALQAIGVITTLVLIYRQVRIGRRASMLEALSLLEKKWANPVMESARISVCELFLNPTTRGSKTLDPASNALLLFFEDVGLLLHLGILERD